jgi:hypothetical protein
MIGTATESELNVPLKLSDYPRVKFWNWTAFQNETKVEESKMAAVRGRSRASKGINVMMLYIE